MVAVLLIICSADALAERLTIKVPLANIRSGPGTKYDIIWTAHGIISATLKVIKDGFINLLLIKYHLLLQIRLNAIFDRAQAQTMIYYLRSKMEYRLRLLSEKASGLIFSMLMGTGDGYTSLWSGRVQYKKVT
jgi:hypothetical protein